MLLPDRPDAQPVFMSHTELNASDLCAAPMLKTVDFSLPPSLIYSFRHIDQLRSKASNIARADGTIGRVVDSSIV